MEFRALGALEIKGSGGQMLVPRRRKQRLVVAVLLLHANTPVSAEMLLDALWTGAAPSSARANLQSYISDLRRLLHNDEPAGPPRLQRVRTGYLLRAGDDELDITVFERLAVLGRQALTGQHYAVAAQRLTQALARWRGAVLQDLPLPDALRPEAERLEQLRLVALEDSIEARLMLEEPTVLAAELTALTAIHPLRERLWAQLMLTLYRCGRQADALDAYQGVYQLLDKELAVQPGHALQQLHQQILSADPALISPAAISLARAKMVVPRQLPAPPQMFTGRTSELATLDRVADPSTMVIVAIDGMPGVGKTALAVHWAHRMAQRFPDGQIYLNLHGFTPGTPPVEPADALRRMLEALGVAVDALPDGVDERSALFRSLLSGRRLLLVLDNALDAAQVHPLLPGAPGCLALVTSRRQLTELIAAFGADSVVLDPLTQRDARRLLSARLGPERLAREPSAVDELIALGAGLPLSLALVAAQAMLRPAISLAQMSAELREAGGLDGFTGIDLRAVFASSYRILAPATARMFRLLGLTVGPDIGIAAAASLAGVTVSRARRLLAELALAHLVTEAAPGRYALHDLLRTYATELADDEPEARRRLYDHYVHTCNAGATLMNPYRPKLETPPLASGAIVTALSDMDSASAWFHAEHAALVATVDRSASAGFPEHTVALAATLTTFFDRRGHWPDWVRTQRTALAAARSTGDRLGQAHAHRRLARAYTRMSHHPEAQSHLTVALELFAELDDAFGLANSHLDMAALMEHHGRYTEALDHATRALQISPDTASQANAHNSIGWYHAQLGQRREALTHCEMGLHLVRELGNRDGEAHAWDSVGFAHHKLGDDRLARLCLERALALFRELGDRYYEAIVLKHIGEVTGDRAAYEAAHEILDDLGHPSAGGVRAKLEAMPEDPDRPRRHLGSGHTSW